MQSAIRRTQNSKVAGRGRCLWGGHSHHPRTGRTPRASGDAADL